MDKTVGILIPVYNAAGFIERCIKSILNQTYQNIKVFMIDDGSTDETYVICKSYAESDSRIFFEKQENKGVCYTRQRLVDLAMKEGKIDYIAFVDADDFIHSTYISRLVEIQGGGYRYCLGRK